MKKDLLIPQWIKGHGYYTCAMTYKYGYNSYLIKGNLHVGLNGRSTAFINFERLCTNYDNIRFGFKAGKHFKGKNASHSARAWFRYMANNCPDYVQATEMRATLQGE